MQRSLKTLAAVVACFGGFSVPDTLVAQSPVQTEVQKRLELKKSRTLQLQQRFRLGGGPQAGQAAPQVQAPPQPAAQTAATAQPKAPVVLSLEDRVQLKMGDYVESLVLARMMVAANPAILDDKEVLFRLYREFGDKTVRPENLIQSQIEAFKAQMRAYPAPKGGKFVLTYSAGLDRNAQLVDYDAGRKAWPIRYYSDGAPKRYPVFWVPPVASRFKVSMELPDLPNLSGIPMAAEQSVAFRKKFIGNRATNYLKVHVFIELRGMTFDPARSQFLADVTYEGVEIRSGDTVFIRHVAQPSAGQPASAPSAVPGQGTVATPAPAPAIPRAPAQKPTKTAAYALTLAKMFPGSATERQGYFRSNNARQGLWGKLAVAAMLDRHPELLDSDLFAAGVAPALLTGPEHERLTRGYDRFDPTSMNQFDLRDVGQRARSEFGALMKSRAFAGPYRFYTVRGVNLEQYDFDKQHFPLNFGRQNSRDISETGNHSTGIPIRARFAMGEMLPTAIPLPPDQARILAAHLQMGDRPVPLYAAIYISSGPLAGPRGMGGYIDAIQQGSISGSRDRAFGFDLEARIDRVEIFTDQELTEIIYRFDGRQPPLPDSSEAIALQALNRPNGDLDDVLALAERQPGGQGALAARVNFEAKTPQRRAAMEARQELRKEKVAQGDGTVWLHGTIRVGDYDAQTGMNTLSDLRLNHFDGHSGSSGSMRLTTKLVTPFDKAKLDPRALETFARAVGEYEISKMRLPLRLHLRPVSASVEGKDGPVTIAYEIVEAYVVAADTRSLGRVDLLAHVELATAAKPAAAAPKPALKPGAEVDVTPDLWAKLALAHGGNPDKVQANGMDWIILSQLLQDKTGMPSLGGQAYDSTGPFPDSILFPRLRQEMVARLKGMDLSSITTLNATVILANSATFRLHRSKVQPKMCGVLMQRSNNNTGFDPREAALLKKMGVPSFNTIKADYAKAAARGNYQTPRSAPYGVLVPKYGSALACGADWSFNPVVQKQLGVKIHDVDRALRDRLPRVLIVVPEFPALNYGRDGAFNAAQIKGQIDRVVTLPGPSGIPDIGVVLKVPEYDLQKIDLPDDTTVRRTKIKTLRPEDMVEKARTAANGAAFDIVGITLDMTVDEARKILDARFKDPVILRSQPPKDGRTKPFRNAIIYMKPDLSERVTLYVEDSTGHQDVLGVERVLAVKDFAVPMRSVKQAALDKYGDPDVDGGGSELWMEWGDFLHNPTSGRRNSCQLHPRSSNRIEAMTNQKGETVIWWKTYDWAKLRSGFMAFVPELPHFSPGQTRYGDCGKILVLRQTQWGIVTALTDLKVYEDALNRSIAGELGEGVTRPKGPKLDL